MSLPQTIAHYRITGKLGEGAMGVVYRATDSKLDREVALKLIPDSLASDAKYMGRFQREAKVLASLNHPNIASIYGLEESNSARVLIMELVEGPTLADRIKKGPLPVKEVLAVASQIAEALEYAHEKGVVHRDLKPANIKLTPDGVVKVLDFGLAKTDRPRTSGDWEDAPTSPVTVSHPGLILGTAAYMAPEQARGDLVDKRADIWAFGVVLWEMLVGKRLFGGATSSDVLAEVLQSNIDFDTLPPDTPVGLRRLVKRCLQRDRKNRLQAFGDARIEIEDCRTEPINIPQPNHSRLLWVLSTVFVLAGLSGAMFFYFRHTTPDNPVIKFLIPPPDSCCSYIHLAPSPDGRFLAFGAGDSVRGDNLWLRRLDSLEAQRLDGTEGALLPFWSPDSKSVGFWAGRKLEKIDLSTSVPALPRILCEAPAPGGATWSRDGVILFGGNGTPLRRVVAEGGDSAPVTVLDEAKLEKSHLWPWFLPDGRHFLYTVVSYEPNNSGVFVGALGSRDRKRLLGDLSNAAYVELAGDGGYLLYTRQGILTAQRFDPRTLSLVGLPVSVAEQVEYSVGWAEGFYAVSDTGVLVYLEARPKLFQTQLTWFDRTGKRSGIVGEPAQLQWWPRISPDGNRVAVERIDPKTEATDIWLIDLARGITSRFTHGPDSCAIPVWSPDGSRLAYWRKSRNVSNLYMKETDSDSNEELLVKSEKDKWANSWSPDGRLLLYTEAGPSFDIWVLPVEGNRMPHPFLHSDFNEANGQFSPDGKWVAYQSDETGKYEIYLCSFHASDASSSPTFANTGRTKRQVSSGGGRHPRWRQDGKELFYRTDDGNILAVQINSHPTLQVSTPKLLFQTHFHHHQANFTVTADGQRFLIPVPIEGSAGPEAATVVLNWTQKLRH